MSSRPLRTSEVAQAVGVHPNTVRLYEQWGYIAPVPRSPADYRLFTPDHVELDEPGATRSRRGGPPLACRSWSSPFRPAPIIRENERAANPRLRGG